jgi:DNA-binding NarL/FixJ family response regulator
MVDPAKASASGEGAKVRVTVALIIDDHPLFCEALSMTLRSALDVNDVQVASTLGNAVEWLQRGHAPDLILLDLKLPDVNGLDGLLQLKKVAPGVPIVVVSALSDERIVGSVMEVGVSGFIPKYSPHSVFVEALKRIWAGGVYAPKSYVTQGARRRTTPEERDAVDLMALLTPQQARILHFVGEGKLNKQIAYELDISEATVKAHLTAILRKLNVQNRTQAVLVAQNARFAAILHAEGDLS